MTAIDDDPMFLHLIHDLLQSRGWEGTSCSDAGLAVEYVKHSRPDVILLDIRLGTRCTGWDILDVLASDPATAGFPVIVCSAAWDEVQRRASWLKNRGIAILDKPFDIDDFYDVIDNIGNQQSSCRPTGDAFPIPDRHDPTTAPVYAGSHD